LYLYIDMIFFERRRVSHGKLLIEIGRERVGLDLGFEIHRVVSRHGEMLLIGLSLVPMSC